MSKHRPCGPDVRRPPRPGGRAARVLIAPVLLWAALATPLPAAPPWASYTVTNFADDFSGAALDTTVWGFYDDRTNVTVSGGQLHLNTVALGTNWSSAGNWDAGGVRTLNFRQKFGYFETRMQIGGADGLNNAFWMNTPPAYVNDHDRLEIDITEAHFHGDHHMNIHDWAPVHVSSGSTLGTNLYPGFHTVGLEWTTAGSLLWYLDGAVVRTFSAGSLNACNTMLPLEVLFSTKVLSFAGTAGAGLLGTHMDVDHVRVWQKPGWRGTTNGNWGSSGNWGADGVPGAGDAAIFNGAADNRVVSLAGDKAVKELYFCTPHCPAFTFAAGNRFLLGSLAAGSGWGGVTVNNDVTNRQVIHTELEAQNPLVFACYSTRPDVSLDLEGDLTSSATNRTLYFAGDGRVNMAGRISGEIGEIHRHNPGELRLTASNAFTGLLRIQDGLVVVTTNGALGLTGGSAYTMVGSGATLALASNVNYALTESVHLLGAGASGRQGALDLLDGSSAALAGPITLDTNAAIGSGASQGLLTLDGNVNTRTNAFTLTLRGNGTAVLNGVVSGDGDVVKTGSGTAVLNGANTFRGGTTVTQGTLVGDTASLPGAISNNALVVFDQAVNATRTNGITGSGSLVKTGTGTLTLATAVTCGGTTTVSNGTLHLSGSLAGPVVVAGGRLRGTGTVGNAATIDGGLHEPGDSTGIMTVLGSYTLRTGGTLRIDINGTTAGSGHDQVRAAGTGGVVTLAGALEVVATNGPAVGTSCVIITNLGTAPVSGGFAGKPQHFIFASSGSWWQIRYDGGDGNDVVLTVVPRPAAPVAGAPGITGGLVRVAFTGDSNLAYRIQASTNLADWASLLLTNAPLLPFSWNDPESTNFPARYYRIQAGP